MQVYVTMANSHIKVDITKHIKKRNTHFLCMQPSILQKVVESVADVIQVLPPERAIAPLMVYCKPFLYIILLYTN
jgi:hypothetical protein